MDADEVFTLIISGVVFLKGAAAILRPMLAARLLRPSPLRWIFLPILLVAFLPQVIAVTRLAPPDVRDHAEYITLFLLFGGAAEMVMLQATRLLGVGLVDDVIERRNPAAAFVIAAALVGFMLICAASNIGNGETIWTTIGPFVLAAGTWFALWALFQFLTQIADDVTIDRNIPRALLLSALLLINGALLARPVIGDFVSPGAMLRDLVTQGWPALPVTLVAALAHRLTRHPRAGARR